MKRSEIDFKLTFEDMAAIIKGGMHIFSTKNGEPVSIGMDDDQITDDEHDAADALKDSWNQQRNSYETFKLRIFNLANIMLNKFTKDH